MAEKSRECIFYKDRPEYGKPADHWHECRAEFLSLVHTDVDTVREFCRGDFEACGRFCSSPRRADEREKGVWEKRLKAVLEG